MQEAEKIGSRKRQLYPEKRSEVLQSVSAQNAEHGDVQGIPGRDSVRGARGRRGPQDSYTWGPGSSVRTDEGEVTHDARYSVNDEPVLSGENINPETGYEDGSVMEDGTMVLKEQLVQTLRAMGLDIYETASDVEQDSSIQLLDLDELCRFIQTHSVDTAFYHYAYTSADDLKIDSEVIEQLNIDSDMWEVLEEKFEEYNESILKLDFSRPYSLTVYCTYQNFIYFVSEVDFWFNNEGVELPLQAARCVVNKYRDDIIATRKAAKQKREQGRKQLRNQILNDEDFHKCSNIQLRRAYTQKIFNGNKELQRLFFSKEHGLYDIPFQTFIEEIWREYKESK